MLPCLYRAGVGDGSTQRRVSGSSRTRVKAWAFVLLLMIQITSCTLCCYVGQASTQPLA